MATLSAGSAGGGPRPASLKGRPTAVAARGQLATGALRSEDKVMQHVLEGFDLDELEPGQVVDAPGAPGAFPG